MKQGGKCQRQTQGERKNMPRVQQQVTCQPDCFFQTHEKTACEEEREENIDSEGPFNLAEKKHHRNQIKARLIHMKNKLAAKMINHWNKVQREDVKLFPVSWCLQMKTV